MVIVDDAAVAADGNIHTGLFEIFVTGFANVNQGGSLSAADTLGLAGDADGAAADADLDKVSAAVCQEPEAFRVNHIAGAYFHFVAVVIANPFQRNLLPFGKAFGRVDAQYVRSGFHQSRYPFRVIPGVDAGANHVAFLIVQQFQRIFFMGYVVLAEYHIQ